MFEWIDQDPSCPARSTVSASGSTSIISGLHGPLTSLLPAEATIPLVLPCLVFRFYFFFSPFSSCFLCSFPRLCVGGVLCDGTRREQGSDQGRGGEKKKKKENKYATQIVGRNEKLGYASHHNRPWWVAASEETRQDQVRGKEGIRKALHLRPTSMDVSKLLARLEVGSRRDPLPQAVSGAPIAVYLERR